MNCDSAFFQSAVKLHRSSLVSSWEHTPYSMAVPQLMWGTVLLLVLLHLAQTSLTPRITFSSDSPGRVLSWFKDPSVQNTTTLLLSNDGDILYVGARDALLSLNVSQPGVMTVVKKVNWTTFNKKLEECSKKGKKEETECINVIRVLLFLNDTHIYACGTYAFSPTCTYIDTKTFSFVNDGSGTQITEDGRSRCPYDPYQKHTAIIVDGELYTGTVGDFQGKQPVISRFVSGGSVMDMKVEDSLGWLQDPTFISSTFIPGESGNDKVYFFFSEVGKEYDFIEKFTVSRIAQVCTSDRGGDRILQKRWTTFVKALMLCLSPNELPYNIIQDVVTLPPPEGGSVDDTLFYGVFTSQWSGNSGRSAVCAFKLKDIKAVFAGEYKELNRDTQRWRTRNGEKFAQPGECGLHGASDKALTFVKENFLADQVVQPVDGHPALISPNQHYKKIVVERTTASDKKLYTVLFLLTETGFLHKVVLLKKGPHIIEEIQVFRQPQSVENLLLSVKKGVVFVGSSEGVFQIPVSNCTFYTSCGDCILAQDPFCAWDSSRGVCSDISLIQSKPFQDVEGGNANSCSSIAPRGKSAGYTKQPTDLRHINVRVSPNVVVRLNCSRNSQLAIQHWERGAGKTLSENLYLQPQDGILQFLASQETMGEYFCFSEENGFRQLLVHYIVVRKDGSSDATQEQPRPTSVEDWEGKEIEGNWQEKEPTTIMEEVPNTRLDVKGSSRTFNKPRSVPGHKAEVPANTDRDHVRPLPISNERSYYGELVAVSIFLALALTALLVGALYIWRQKNRGKARVQGCQDNTVKSSDTDSPTEHALLTQDQGPPIIVLGNGKDTDSKQPDSDPH
ncbi:semaphorin-4A [Lepisosteus oculatus]|uniref:semaphorin-4A n=1 Tax=Lepisosteus oculatus TaxID=7918 RepID=UPI0037152C4D